MTTIHHAGVTVSDLARSLDEAVSEPIVAAAPMAGFRCVYVLDPDRVRVELVEPAASAS